VTSAALVVGLDAATVTKAYGKVLVTCSTTG
jgi:hypothetical protein